MSSQGGCTSIALDACVIARPADLDQPQQERMVDFHMHLEGNNDKSITEQNEPFSSGVATEPQ